MTARACGKCESVEKTKTGGCRPCANRRAREWRERNPDKRVEAIKSWREKNREHLRAYARGRKEKNAAASRRRRALKQPHLLKRFGITTADYASMLERQGGACAICGNPPGRLRLAVDHDHHTGAVRGLLCNKCNIAIGSLGDSPALLRRALTYLEEYGPERVEIEIREM